MGKINRRDDIVLLFDSYSVESRNLHDSFKLAGYDCSTVVIDDDGFLPSDVISVYGSFLGDYKNATNIPGKPLYFNQVEVPDYWEISGTGSNGKIMDLSHERGRIFYAEPKHERLVKIVDWMDDKGRVRMSDHFNCYGALYARTIFNANSQKVNRTYFTVDGKEKIVENYVTGDIIVNEEHEVKVFRNKTEFVCYFMQINGYAEKRVFFNSLSYPFFVSQRLPGIHKEDILFWNEPIGNEIPGNMQVILNHQSPRCESIYVQKHNSYEKMTALGVDKNMVRELGYIYPFKKENQHQFEALICTNSDNIEQLEKIVRELPEIKFHITAVTEMSAKLMAIGAHENATTYPGVKMNIQEELFLECDLYFDINHEGEILDAVHSAFLHNQLIFGFEETLHNKNYVAPENVYKAADVEQMIADVKMSLMNTELFDIRLKQQRKAALAENVQSYDIFDN